MIEAEFYQSFYSFIVTLLTLFCFFKYSRTVGPVKESIYPGLVLCLLCILYIGYRPLSIVFGDMTGYAQYHDQHLHKDFQFTWDTLNYIWDNFNIWSASIGLEHRFIFVFLAFMYFASRYASCVKMFPSHSYTAFLFFLGSFLTFTSGVNGMKAGVASSLFALAVAYRREWRWAVVFLAMSWGFHHAFQVCLIGYLITYFYKDTRVYIAFWIFALIMAIGHVTYFQEFFADQTDEQGAGYLVMNGTGWRTGMRYDFVAYSVVPIILGYYVRFRRNYKDLVYTFVLNLYTLLNGIWMLAMYASYTNRIAALSWLLYPIVISYPFLSKNFDMPQSQKNKFTAIALIFNLGFTLFMTVFYYGLIKVK